MLGVMRIETMKYILAFLFLIGTQGILANDICSPVESQGEGHWPLTEDAFSQQAVMKELQKLEQLFEGKIEVAEEFIYQSSIIIEGGFYRMEIEKLKNNPKNYEYAVKRFCKFMRERAVVVH